MGIRGSSTCSAHPERLQGAGREPARRDRQGAHHRLQHPEHRPLQAGRRLRRRCAHCLQNAIGYAKERKAFGKTIADFGLIREKMAQMAVGVYVGEAMVYRTVGMMDAALGEIDKNAADAAKQIRKAIEEYAVECSIIKVWGSEMLDNVVDETGADLRRLRLRRGVSGGARLSRLAREPHLRGHQRDQPARSSPAGC